MWSIQLTTEKIQQSLDICFKTAHILKEQFPNDLMKIDKNTIIANGKKNNRLISKRTRELGMGNAIARYMTSKKRVIITQKFLKTQQGWQTALWQGMVRHNLEGNFAVIELICHELAHHRTSGHAKGFKKKYLKLFGFMVNDIISGNYYRR